MKVKVALLAVAAFFVLAGSASGFYWHLSMGLARFENERFARTFCEEDSECLAWNGSHCRRVTESRVDCEVAWWYPAPEGYEEVCANILHWGVDRSGRIRLKGHSRTYCGEAA